MISVLTDLNVKFDKWKLTKITLHNFDVVNISLPNFDERKEPFKKD